MHVKDMTWEPATQEWLNTMIALGRVSDRNGITRTIKRNSAPRLLGKRDGITVHIRAGRLGADLRLFKNGPKGDLLMSNTYLPGS